MARGWSVMRKGLGLVQLTWVAVLALVVSVAVLADAPTAIVGAAVALALLFAVGGRAAYARLHWGAGPATGPRHEERRLRGSFRRQSAPDTPGRPRRPRAPGRGVVPA